MKRLFFVAFFFTLFLLPLSTVLAQESQNNDGESIQESEDKEPEFSPMARIGQGTYTLSSGGNGVRSFNMVTNTGQLRAEFSNVISGSGVTVSLYRSNGTRISTRSVAGGSNTTKEIVWTAVPRGETLYFRMWSLSPSNTVTLRAYDI